MIKIFLLVTMLSMGEYGFSEHVYISNTIHKTQEECTSAAFNYKAYLCVPVWINKDKLMKGQNK